jgi:NADH:ubiquinone oxidoreductase subunit 6 (subunit J)
MMNITTLIGSVGFAFFFGLMVYSYRQGERRYVPGLVLITLATLAILARGLFFPTASPHPATLSGSFRLASGALAVTGWIMVE